MMIVLLVALLFLDSTTTLALHHPNTIIIGGSSGMGKATAAECLKHGSSQVLLVSRDATKLDRAKAQLCQDRPTDVETSIQTKSVDCRDEQAVKEFASSLDEDCWDCLVITAADKAVHGPVDTLETTDVRAMLESKFWTAYLCAKYIGPRLRPGGAIVFCSGILNRRPGVNCAPLAIANGALEGLTRSLALEWGPSRQIRVNCLSPGFCDTERFDHMDPQRKENMLQNTAASLPLQTVGRPQDMAQAIYYLMTAEFCTGVVLDVDGGHMIRQYANPTNDPMRKK